MHQNRCNALYADGKGKMCRIVENEEPKPNQAVATIVCEGDAIGAVILLSNDKEKKFGEFEEKMALLWRWISWTPDGAVAGKSTSISSQKELYVKVGFSW